MKRILFIFLIICNVAHAEIPKSRAINAIIGEAEDQGQMGMNLIACAIRNRGTLDGVYGENSPRVKAHLYSEDIEAKATVAWEKSADPAECSFVKGATHWENIKDFGRPKWAKLMKKVYKHHDHTFYK